MNNNISYNNFCLFFIMPLISLQKFFFKKNFFFSKKNKNKEERSKGKSKA